jgi:hypothetical protein
MMTGEAQFHVDGTVNKQNCHVWGEQNPHAVVMQDQQTPALTAAGSGLKELSVLSSLKKRVVA